ncbi:MAG: maltose alpha-D-glucosyltransferase [Dehalococcoidia bacterium]
MSPLEDDPLWYKHAVVYEIPVRAFFDSNGDGIGDFRGLTSKLEYLERLGVDCLWLLPFMQSPLRDGGYDVSDYTSIHPSLGTMSDFNRFIREAHERGIRVITELVVNHTSDQHPWFQRARRAPRGSALRDMYVWSDSDQKWPETRIIFTDTETSNWAWDPIAGQFYWHRFFSHQPDLNFDSPRTRRAVENLMRFWYDRQVDGLRLDAIPYLFERDGTNNENLPETHTLLRQWRSLVDARYPGRAFLAEANQWPADVVAYFGEGDECHMAYHFPLMPRMFMALRQEDRHPIVDILAQTPEIPQNCQWCLFLRNHDELTLEMVTAEERDYMYSVYAADMQMRRNLGIGRRLSPLLNNNRRAIELLHCLLFTLPGTPVLYYGDEIGMGDNIYLGDRDGVRTPMQWSADRNAGFSTADSARLYLPVNTDPQYGYQAVSVEAQERSPSSLLNWMRRMIAVRKQRRRIFGSGSLHFLHPENRHVLAYLRHYEGEVVLIVANLSRFVQPVTLDLSAYGGCQPIEVIGGGAFPIVTDQPYFLSLGPHAFYWFDLVPQSEPIVVTAEPEGGVDIGVDGDWDAVFRGEALRTLEEEVLPRSMPPQRWFGGKDRTIAEVRLADALPLTAGAAPSWLALVDVTYVGGDSETYALPLAIALGQAARRVRDESAAAVLSSVSGPRGRGVLYDGLASPEVVRQLVSMLREGRTIRGRHGQLRAEPARAFDELFDALETRPAVQTMSGEQSNTSVRIGEQVILKLFRRITPGPHPEVEAGRHFELVGFDRAPRLAGTFEYAPREGDRSTLAIAHELVWNQRDGWGYTVAELARFLAAADAIPEVRDEPLDPNYVESARVLGQRTAEMHLALADERGLESFRPEPLEADDVDVVANRITRRLRALASALDRVRPDLATAEGDAVDVLRAAAARRGGWRPRLPRGRAPLGHKIRCHGDYHLGQVLWALNDFYIVDFEGEVGLSLEERRAKASALTDVAGMLRSFDYAATFAMRERSREMPTTEALVASLEPATARWVREAGAAFLDTYRAVVEGAGLLPEDPERFDALLRLHLLDKALHELEYELANRPDWISIPLRAAADLLGSSAS